MNGVSGKILKYSIGGQCKIRLIILYLIAHFTYNEMVYIDNFSSDNINVPCRFMYSCGNIAATCLIIEGSRG